VLAVALSQACGLTIWGEYRGFVRGYGHDAALALFAYMLFRPEVAGPRKCGLVVVAVLFGTELGQALLAWNAQQQWLPIPRVGTFDWWDFVAFATGTGVAWLLDLKTLGGKLSPHD